MAEARDAAPPVDRARIAGQLSRLNDLYVLGSISREEYVGRKRELEASLNTATGQPTYAEAVIVKAARLLNDLGELWAKATPTERTEIAQSLFAPMRVRDDQIVHVRLARDEYLPLVASSEARVGVTRPTGVGRADAMNIRIPIEGAELLKASESA